MCQAERVRRREVVDRAASSGFNAYADDVVPMEALGSAYRRLARHDRFGGAVKAGARCAILLCSRKCTTSRPVLVTETSRNRIEAAKEALGSAYCRLATHDRLGGAVKANDYETARMQQSLTHGEGAFQATFPPPGDGGTGDALPPQRLRRSER